MIEQWEITDREAWLARRQQDIGASEIGALLGVSDYETPYSLWTRKSGLIERDQDRTVITEEKITLSPLGRGLALEPLAIDLARQLKPKWTIKRGTTYFRDPDARLGATPDAFANDPDRGFGLIQFKSIEPSVFRQKWINADGEIEAPLEYVVQVNQEAMLTGAAWAVIGVMTISFTVDLLLIEVPVHAGVQERIRAEVPEFWRRVEERDAPPANYARDGETICGMLRESDPGTVIDLSGHNRIRELGARQTELAAMIKSAQDERSAIRAEILEAIGTAETAMVDERIFATAKTIRKKEFLMKATTYRDLRIKEIRA